MKQINILPLILLNLITTSVSAQQQKGFAPVNGLKLYYEIHGEGKPILLFHGSYMGIDSWGHFLQQLAKTRQVIAVEMQGHGHTADIDRPFSYTSMADDAAQLLKYLKIDKADILGYSLGGTIALEFGIRHPELTNNIVVISSVFKHEGWSEDVRTALKSIKPEFLDNTPMKAEYDRIAPNPKHWRSFVKKLTDFGNTDFNLGEENIKNMKSPVLLIMGDNDGVDPDHIIQIYRLLGGSVFADMAGLPKSQLAILPGKTHVSLMEETQPMADMINAFLDRKKTKK